MTFRGANSKARHATRHPQAENLAMDSFSTESADPRHSDSIMSVNVSQVRCRLLHLKESQLIVEGGVTK